MGAVIQYVLMLSLSWTIYFISRALMLWVAAYLVRKGWDAGKKGK